MRTYCFRSCISITHSNDYKKENAHGHTVEIAAFLRLDNEVLDVHKFGDTEVKIETYLAPYQECYLNEMEGFEKNVSLEYLGEVLFSTLEDRFFGSTISMERLEISETPLRTYIITKTI